MATAIPRQPSGPALSVSHYRSASPTSVKISLGGGGGGVSRASVSVTSSSSPGGGASRSRRSCMCSPTSHQGSFRCSLHKERKAVPAGVHGKPQSPGGGGGLGQRQMGSAVVRVAAAVEGGQWARRAIAEATATAARPSPSALQRRRAGGFRPRPSRLSAVSMAGDPAGDNDHQ